MAHIDNVNLQDADNNALLHKSVLNNRLEEVKTLLKKGADASLANDDGKTPLHNAVLKKYHQIVEVILKYSKRDKLERFIDAQTLENYSTALHIASNNGCYQSVSYLLSYGANFEIQNKNGSRPIDLAKDEKVKKLLVNVELDSRLAAAGKFKILEARLKQYSQADLVVSSYARNGERMTSLQMAVLNTHYSTVREIVNARVRLRSRCYYKICKGEMIHKIGELIEYGTKSSEQLPWLIMHCLDLKLIGGESMANEIIEILSAGDNIVKVSEKVFKPDNSEPYEQSGVLDVIEETLQVLQFKSEYVDCGNDNNAILQRKNARYYKMLYLNDIKDKNYDECKNRNKIISYMGILQVAICQSISRFMGKFFTIKLIEAAKRNDLRMFDKCIKEEYVGVSLYLYGDDKRTPLHYAAEHGNEKMVIKLLKKKAKVNSYTESNNETPLYLAVKNGHLGIVRMLLQNCNENVLVDETSEEKWTPMHVAAKLGRLDILKCLLERSAIYDGKDKNGKRPVELSDNTQVVSFLEVIDKLFEIAKKGDENLVTILNAIIDADLIVICNARNTVGQTLAKAADMCGHGDIASQVQEILVKISPISSKTINIEDSDERVRAVQMRQLRKLLHPRRK